MSYVLGHLWTTIALLIRGIHGFRVGRPWNALWELESSSRTLRWRNGGKGWCWTRTNQKVECVTDRLKKSAWWRRGEGGFARDSIWSGSRKELSTSLLLSLICNNRKDFFFSGWFQYYVNANKSKQEGSSSGGPRERKQYLPSEYCIADIALVVLFGLCNELNTHSSLHWMDGGTETLGW